jgi:hypothetical protein
MVRLSSHRLPFSLSAGTPPPIILPPPVTTRHSGWGFPIIRRRVEPRARRQPRHAADRGLVELRLSGSVIERAIAHEWATGAMQLRASGTAIVRVQDGDLLELYLLGVLSFDDLLLMAGAATIEAALLLG